MQETAPAAEGLDDPFASSGDGGTTIRAAEEEEEGDEEEDVLALAS